MAHDVFVSHSAKDKEIANRVCSGLEAEGVTCWIAPRDVLPAQIWAEAIVEAIDSCKVMVAILSSNVNESGQIKREIERADASRAALIPFFIEEFKPSKYLEYYIGNTHWFDASAPPLESHIPKLAKTIKQLVARQEGEERADEASAAGAPGPSEPTAVRRPQTAATHASSGPERFPKRDTEDDDARRGYERAAEPTPRPGKTRLTLVVVGAAVLLAAVVGVIALMRRGDTPPRQNNTAQATPTAAPTPAPTNETLAAAKEREGFQHLLDGRYDQAIASLKESEAAFPQYHSVHEVARLLERSRASLDNPDNRNRVLLFILSKYTVPEDLRAKLRAAAGASRATANTATNSSTATNDSVAPAHNIRVPVIINRAPNPNLNLRPRRLPNRNGN